MSRRVRNMESYSFECSLICYNRQSLYSVPGYPSAQAFEQLYYQALDVSNNVGKLISTMAGKKDMKVYWVYTCDHGHTWTIYREVDAPKQEGDNLCPYGHTAV